MLDTSGPMATNCGDVLALSPGSKEGVAKGPPPVTSCRVRHDDGELPYL